MREHPCCLAMLIWPIVSIIFGTVAGLILGAGVTIWVCILAALRTPASVFKLMRMTATANSEVFATRRCLDYPLRVAVFVLTPVPRVLFVVGLALYCLIFGTLNYIGLMTRAFWKCEWHDLSIYKDDDFCCSIDPSFIKISRDPNDDDGDDHYKMALYGLKCLCALVPGIILGMLPFVPFSAMVLLITLYRLPVNLYKTVKVALFTVVLEWDLKIVALLMLPVSHVVFVLVAFVTALIGSFFHFMYVTTESIVNSESPFHQWGDFRTGLEKYHEAHQQFVGENQIGRFDHPTGIPSGWQGETYNIPIRRILTWQWDFLVCCFLLLLGFPICFTGSLVIFTLKLVPSTFQLWKNLCEEMQIILWPCVLFACLMTPAGVVLFSFMSIVAGTLMSFRAPSVYLMEGYGAGFRDPFKVVGEVDRWDCFGIGCRVFPCLREREEALLDRPIQRTVQMAEESKVITDAYWDRFVSQCVHSTFQLISRKWISLDDVESMEPALVSAIPAIAILEILADSANHTGTNKEDIFWSIDSTLCKKDDRPRLDNIASLLWPKVMRLKKILDQKVESRKVFAESSNVKTLQAMICDNTEHMSSELKAFMEESNVDSDEQPTSRTNREIRSDVAESQAVPRSHERNF